MPITFLALIFVSLLGATANSLQSPSGKPTSKPATASKDHEAFPSMEALVIAALAKLNARDTAGLDRLSLNRNQFLKVYPIFESDTSRSRRDFSCNYYLSDNRKLLLRHIERAGGKSLSLSRFQVDGPVMDHKGFLLNRGIKVWVHDGKDETEIDFRFVKSLVKLESGWKIWSYADD